MVLLSILIPTLPDRNESLNKLLAILEPQLNEQVEVLLDSRPKRACSIGVKRNDLYKRAKGKYSVQIDDDDTVPDYFVKEVLANLGSDCIGYKEHCTINGKVQDSLITRTNKNWYTINNNHFRTPHFKTPILTEHCVNTGVKDMRFGEDHDFAKRILPLLKTETFIPKIMYFYTANSLTPNQHKDRYGL
jgi:glycosyltransferase involved in cell wall biosynthesis